MEKFLTHNFFIAQLNYEVKTNKKFLMAENTCFTLICLALMLYLLKMSYFWTQIGRGIAVVYVLGMAYTQVAHCKKKSEFQI